MAGWEDCEYFLYFCFGWSVGIGSASVKGDEMGVAVGLHKPMARGMVQERLCVCPSSETLTLRLKLVCLTSWRRST